MMLFDHYPYLMHGRKVYQCMEVGIYIRPYKIHNVMLVSCHLCYKFGIILYNEHFISMKIYFQKKNTGCKAHIIVKRVSKFVAYKVRPLVVIHLLKLIFVL